MLIGGEHCSPLARAARERNSPKTFKKLLTNPKIHAIINLSNKEKR